MDDILLKELFKKERWESAIDIGVGKHIDKGILRSLTSPQTRVALFNAIVNDNYAIAPPRIGLIPKDNGDFREVMICEDIDRIVLSIVNNIFFELFPEFVHKSCYSYISGIGCGKVVQNVSKELQIIKSNTIGKKYDLTKYFDTPKIGYIDKVFDKMETKYGKSKVIDFVREFYHSNILFDENGNLIEEYKAIKQGTATSSFLADALLYDIDKTLSNLNGITYWRYSDDILVIGDNYKKADVILKSMLADMGLGINPKKEQILDNEHWFKFLGFNLKGNQITLSKSRVKSFQKEIESRTIKSPHTGRKKAVNQVNRYLYKGNGQFSWATSVLPIINVDRDIETLNTFVMDCIRACETKKKKIGGLGSVNDGRDVTIVRGVGKNVTSNRNKTEKEIDGYFTIKCMQNVLNTDRTVYDMIVRSM